VPHKDAILKQTLDAIKAAHDLDHIYTLDFETYYSRGFSLINKTLAEYIMDDQFKVHMLGVAVDEHDTEVLDPQGIEEWIAQVKGMRDEGLRVGVLCQNTSFDGAILRWRYGLEFDFYLDTQLVSRLLFINLSSSLKNQALRMWPEDDTMRKGEELVQSMGVADLVEASLYDSIKGYCAKDVELTRALLIEYWQGGRVPDIEWRLMHMALRSNIEPQFKIDLPLLHQVAEDAHNDKIAAVASANDYLATIGLEPAGPEVYSSNPKYKLLMERLGCKVPYKLDKKTFEMKPALGKKDPEYVKFKLAHPEHEAVYTARDEIKSTIAASRAKRMIDTTERLPLDGYLPFPLHYHKAHTGRYSGGEKLNMQNLQRNSKHRRALTAPPGYQVAVRDLSNIEMRMNLWFCEQEDLLDEVRGKKDLYSVMASSVYDKPISKDTAPDERNVGKVIVLGLGYSMSWGTFQATMAGGPMGLPPTFFSDRFCQDIKRNYDQLHPMIKQMWRYLNDVVIPCMADPAGEMEVGRYGCIKVRHQRLLLPSGRELQYPGLHQQVHEGARGLHSEYVYDDGTRNSYRQVVWKKLYGGMLLENCIQALSRDVICYQKDTIEQQLQVNGWGHVVGSVHDEVLSLVQDIHADTAYAMMGEVMARPPAWCHDLPLESEGGYDSCYSK
jgi:DNA polymerase bacteriophage-type